MGEPTNGSLDLDGCVDRGGCVVLVGTEMISLIVLTMSSVAVLVALVVLYAWCLTHVIGLH
jgi:hypothetical protein